MWSLDPRDGTESSGLGTPLRWWQKTAGSETTMPHARVVRKHDPILEYITRDFVRGHGASRAWAQKQTIGSSSRTRFLDSASFSRVGLRWLDISVPEETSALTETKLFPSSRATNKGQRLAKRAHVTHPQVVMKARTGIWHLKAYFDSVIADSVELRHNPVLFCSDKLRADTSACPVQY